jgi:hypothetical protein
LALVYALVVGKVIVSTPFLHAQKLLAGGRGMFSSLEVPLLSPNPFLPFREDEASMMEVKEKAYKYGR